MMSYANNQRTIVVYYSSFFTSLEARYTAVKGHREFTYLRKSMRCILDSFHNDINEVEAFDSFINDLLDWCYRYTKELKSKKYLSEQNIISYQEINKKSVKDRIQEFSILFKRIDNIDKNDTLIKHIYIQTKNEQKKPLKDHVYYEKQTKDIFSELIKGLNGIENLLIFFNQKEEKSQTKAYLHSYNQAINEFHQGFSHYSCAEFAYLKLKKITIYSHNNYNRSIGHFRRAILDIYKIILLLITKNKTSPLTIKEYQKIAQIRHKDGINISTDFNQRLQRYTKIIKELCPKELDLFQQ